MNSNSKSADIIRQLAVIIAVAATIIVNGLANALPINGLTTGDISDRFEVFFVPAGYVFSIWGLIYVGLIAYAIYQALPSQRENPKLRSIGWIFVLSCIANIVWIFLWHYELFPLTIVAMVALLLCLIMIYQRLGTCNAQPTTAQRWLVHIPFSVYLGWITVATIANATSLLDYLNWNGFGISEEVWFLIVLGVAVIIAGLMAKRCGDVAYLLVLVWAFIGIGVKHAATPIVSYSAYVAAALVTIFAVVGYLQRRPSDDV